MTMTFKEALIAHLQGQKVQILHAATDSKKSMEELLDENYFGALISGVDKLYTFRLAPRTILVNGVEVPAPEKEAPKEGSAYYTPLPSKENRYNKELWDGCEFDARVLAEGLVYLDKESAIARAKAMLITQEVK